jgi:hypothetical protein
VTRHRQVLAVPGLAWLLGVSLLARVAITADVMALTLYVLLGLEGSYLAAGSVTAGLALGGPMIGRLIDWRGARSVLLGTAFVQLGF